MSGSNRHDPRGSDTMTDLLPCLLPHSNTIHAAELWGSPALCRPDGPPPMWYSPYRWAGTGRCARCTALATAADELDRIETEVAEW